MKQVLFASFESLPFIKTGGLADVVYALPKAINKKEFALRVVLPLLKCAKDKFFERLKYVTCIEVNSGFIKEKANIYACINEGIEYYFIENDTFFNRDDVYGYHDDAVRFSFYMLAIIEMMNQLDYYPDIIHENDYHSAVLPALCKLKYQDNPNIKKIKHIFTIHNLAYQGIYDKQVLFDYLGFDYQDYANGDLRYNDSCNFMKIGIVFADCVTTVSQTYAKEIQSREYGNGLDTILRYRNEDLYGIVNGIDTNSFNPSNDPLIAYNYSFHNHIKGKAANKKYLQEQLGLKVDEKQMLVGMVSRLTFQKGADLLLQASDKMLAKADVEIAILGTGESRYEYEFKMLENKYPGKFVYYCGYNAQMANQMYAGLDLLLMPSLFEPCGISQLIAMHYGTLPLVRETGGLKDTVEPLNEYEQTGNGFSFANYDSKDLLIVFDYAYKQFKTCPKTWKMLIRNAMRKDVSFKLSALEYENLYKKELEDES